MCATYVASFKAGVAGPELMRPSPALGPAHAADVPVMQVRDPSALL
jgi:hypothetical protein